LAVFFFATFFTAFFLAAIVPSSERPFIS
jgi:hypothetical protein